MSFTTPCFIRKSTPELTDMLYRLGNRAGNSFWHLPNTLLVADKDQYTTFDDERGRADYLIQYGYIDCGENEELFLALAALRDDSDYMQWFTNGTDFIKCEREDWPDMYSVLCSGRGKEYMNELDKYRKATPTEIIAHFKQK